MNLINLLVKDIIPFAADRNLDLLFIVKLIDYRLASIKVNIENAIEVETYIKNVMILNTLILSLGILTEFSDQERKAYDNELLISIMETPDRLVKYKEYKLKVIQTKFVDDVILFDTYIAENS